MPKGTPKKRVNKTKEELLAQFEQQKNNEKQKVLVRTVIWPALNDHCKTIQEAKVILEVISNIMMRRVMIVAGDLKFEALELDKFLASVPEAEKYKTFLDIFKSSTITEATGICDALKNGINNFTEAKVNERPLSEIEIDKLLAPS